MVKFKVEYEITNDIAFNDVIIDLKGCGYDKDLAQYTDTWMPFHSNFVVKDYQPYNIKWKPFKKINNTLNKADISLNNIAEELYMYCATSSISTFINQSCTACEDGSKWVIILVRQRDVNNTAKFKCYFEEAVNPDNLNLMDIVLDYADKFNISCNDISVYVLNDKYRRENFTKTLDENFAYGYSKCGIEVARLEPYSNQIIGGHGCHDKEFKNQTLYCTLV